MNKQQRAAIAAYIKESGPGLAQSTWLMQEMQEFFEAMRDEEQDKFDNLPEGLQQADQGLAMEEAIEKFEEAIEYASEAYSNLESLTAAIEEVESL